MFLIVSTYAKKFEMDDPVLREHLDFVNKLYDEGMFVAFGARVPRVGGVILARGEDEDAIRKTMQDDPFVREGIAEYAYTQCGFSRAVHPDLISS